MRKTTLAGALLLVAIIAFGWWYNWRYSMDIVTPYEVNSKQSSQRLLIATQGSPYKTAVTSGIVDTLANQDVYIQIVDATQLGSISTTYDAYLLIHTWEVWKPPIEVTIFVDHLPKDTPLFVIGTSGGGDLQLEDVDGITSASQLSHASQDINQVVAWLQGTLGLTFTK